MSCGCEVPPGGGCRPCLHKKCQLHRHLVTTDTTRVVSYYDNRPVKVHKQTDCCTANLVYLLQCTLHQKQYCGSSVNFKSRWSKHKNDMIHGKGEDCGFCRHWATDHSDSPYDLSHVQKVLLDQVDDRGPREENFHKLQLVQNHAARLVTKADKRAHSLSLLKELHWLPIKQRVSYKVALIVFKCLNDET